MDTGQKIYELIKTLYPINRSITGNGVRETLSVISKIIPLKITEVPTRTRVLDWEVPMEWNIQDAWVKNSDGEKIIDFKMSNLSVLNYSIPVDQIVDIKELKEHLYTLPNYPEWIPYRTSYHNKNWGFCLSHKQFESMKDEDYHVKIDSSLELGFLTYGEFYIEGESELEILISTHICHPSLANDNLSGIAVSTFLANELQKSRHKYSYRFLFVPATIGSISWLSQNKHLINKIKHGLVITLLGDNSKFHYKKSRRGAEIDEIVIKALKNLGMSYEVIDFYPYGYDERQYCSPGFNLPVGRLTRKPHGEFPEYHTSADNLDFVDPENLEESFKLLLTIFNIIETKKIYLNLSPFGEPQLGKRGLFRNVGGATKTKDYEMALLWVLNLSDGYHSLSFISERSGLDTHIINKAANSLLEVGLIKEVTN